MNAGDYFIDLLLSVMLIIGVYQFYFWCQRNAFAAPRELGLSLDERIPYWPAWVWVYSGIYYPLILYLNLVLDSPRQFTHVAASYLLLLSAQMAFFVLFPVTTPVHWRAYNQRRTPCTDNVCMQAISVDSVFEAIAAWLWPARGADTAEPAGLALPR